jgi:hypothetical protein
MMKFIQRYIRSDEVITPAGDQKVTKRHPERANHRPCRVTMVAELVQTSKYSPAQLRQLRGERGVGRVPTAILARL